MEPERWSQVKKVLAMVLEIEAGQRSQVLEQCCDDPELRREVQSYLDAYDDGGDKLEQPAGDLDLAPEGSAGEHAATTPDTIGPYRLLRKLGEGGMGEVFLAQQESPIRRQVALKLIRSDLSSRQVAARFEAERQALAIMSHPSIARVFDAGVSGSGHPYFAMEYIEGAPIIEHCDSRRLDLKSRIELLIEVCRGVHHAHQKGIIHRDLKPSNVLIAVDHDQALPKIIDFGIAKAIGGRPEGSLVTGQGLWLGTPEYMSPEQAGAGAAVDVRSDVYSLGVLLSELVCGVRSFDPGSMQDQSVPTLLQALRDHQPLPLSERFRKLDHHQQQRHAERRGLDPQGLLRRLHGDLDRIAMKALDRDPDQRYDSAAQLAADLRHYLRGEPVTAGPTGAVYQLGKLVRRHRLVVMAVLATVLSLVAGVIGTTVGLVRAQQAEQQAREQARQAEIDAERAGREAETSRQITELLLDILGSANPRNGQQARSLTVREVLDVAVTRLGSELGTQPLVRAKLLTALGRVYRNMAQYKPARALLEESLAIRREHAGDDSLEVADSQLALAVLDIETAELASARSRLETSLATFEAVLGPDDPQAAQTLNFLGIVQKRLGDRRRCRLSFQRALQINEKHFGSDSIKIASNLDNLGLLLVEDGELAHGQELLERALAIQERVLAADDPELAYCLSNLAMALAKQGKLSEARGLFERALAIDRSAYGAEHPNVAIGLANLAELAYDSHDCTAARRYYEQARTIFIKSLGPAHPNVVRVQEAMQRHADCEEKEELLSPEPIGR